MGKPKEAHYRAVAKYTKKNYDQILVKVAKGERDKIKAYAESKGETLSSFIRKAIEEAMKDNS